MTVLIAALLWGIAASLLCLDVLGTARNWGLAPALLERSASLKTGNLLSVLRRPLSALKRPDPALWEEIAYSLAFHLKAGETPVQAVRAVSSDRDTPAHESLRSVCQAYDAGAPFLVALGTRTKENPELGYLAGIFDMGVVSGGDLPALLCHAAEAMRRRRVLRGEARAKLSEARATAVLLSVLPWMIGLFTLGRDSRARAAIFGDPRGRLLVSVAILMWLVGNAVVLLVIRSLSPRQAMLKRAGSKP